MARKCSSKLAIGMLVILSQLCLSFILLNIMNRKSIPVMKNSPEFHGSCAKTIQELQEEIKRLQKRLEKGTETSAEKNGKTANEKYAKPITTSLSRPERHELANNIDLFSRLVTILLYKHKNTVPSSCLDTRKQVLKRLFPKSEILLSSSSSTVGSTFNTLIQRVRTKYFLFLDCQYDLFAQSSDHSSGWLLHALEKVPELDFVSGSFLTGDHLEIPCYRLIMCNWTLSQRYEYQRSIDELMICENIASSFMGRTDSIERLFGKSELAFDDKMTDLSTTDFFLRAKRAGALSGVRPEAMYRICQDNYCFSNTTSTKRKYFLERLPFARKHKVFRFKNPDSETLDLCGRDSPVLGEDICDESNAHNVMLDGGHWAFQGTFAYPFIINNLQSCLFILADFLESKGIPYGVYGGVAIGAVKMRKILPWDSGDVDMFVFYKSRDAFYEELAKFAKEKDYAVFNDNQDPIKFFCFPSQLAWKVGGIITMFHRDREELGNVLKIKTNGRWISYVDLFPELRKYYNLTYLQNKAFQSQEFAHCKIDGHNACLPDFRTLGKHGKTGTFKEFFCET